MGRPLRNGGSSFQVAIRPLVKTSPAETGFHYLDSVPDGISLIGLGHAFFPSHDRGAFAAALDALKAEKPDIVVLLGGMVHEEAFKHVVDDNDVVSKLIDSRVPPEITKVMEKYDGIEERFLALGRVCGEFIAGIAKASGGHVYYIPSVTGMLPNEVDIMRFVLEQKQRLDAWADNHPDEAVKGPPIPENFAEFLGIHKNPNITVLPFGSALVINKKNLFLVGEFKRRHPTSAIQVDLARYPEMDFIMRGFDAKVSSVSYTLPLDSMPESNRRYKAGAEVGHLYDLSCGLGYVRDYDLRAQGFWHGEFRDGKLFGDSVPLIRGADGRRAFHIYDRVYPESEPGYNHKSVKLKLPATLAQKMQAKKKETAKGKSSSKKKS